MALLRTSVILLAAAAVSLATPGGDFAPTILRGRGRVVGHGSASELSRRLQGNCPFPVNAIAPLVTSTTTLVTGATGGPFSDSATNGGFTVTNDTAGTCAGISVQPGTHLFALVFIDLSFVPPIYSNLTVDTCPTTPSTTDTIVFVGASCPTSWQVRWEFLCIFVIHEFIQPVFECTRKQQQLPR